MGIKNSTRKGKRGEREVARLLGGKRVPLSGALDGLPNDVVLPNDLRCEVKVRHKGLSRVYQTLEGYEVVFFVKGVGNGLYAMRLQIMNLMLLGTLSRPLDGTIRPAKGLNQVRAWFAAENADLLAFKADRKDWLIFVPEAVWMQFQDKAKRWPPSKPRPPSRARASGWRGDRVDAERSAVQV